MVGTVTISEITHAAIKEVKFAWTSTNPGGLAGDTTAHAFSGRVLEAVIIPGLAPDVPTNLFDVTVTDANGSDVLHGQGVDCSDVNTVAIVAGLGAVSNSPLTLAVSGAGAAKTGVVILHLGA